MMLLYNSARPCVCMCACGLWCVLKLLPTQSVRQLCFPSSSNEGGLTSQPRQPQQALLMSQPLAT